MRLSRQERKARYDAIPYTPAPPQLSNEQMAEELSRVLFATMHANGFDWHNTAESLIEAGWRKQ